jgi:hypothetical protein
VTKRKRTINGWQNSTKDWTIRTSLRNGDELRCSGRVSSSWTLYFKYICVWLIYVWLNFLHCTFTNKGGILRRVPFGKVEVITSKILRSPPWLDWPLWNICVTNDHGYVPFVVNTSRSFPHSRLITGFVTRLKRRVPLVEQELLIIQEHLSSPFGI